MSEDDGREVVKFFVVDIDDGEVLFTVDQNFDVGDKFGFSMDNAPDHWAVFTVERKEGDELFVGRPVLIVSEQNEFGKNTKKILRLFGGERALMDYLGVDKAAPEGDYTVVELSPEAHAAIASLQERLRAYVDESEETRNLYLEMMAAAYLEAVGLPPEDVELVQEMRTEDGQIKTVWYFRRRE